MKALAISTMTLAAIAAGALALPALAQSEEDLAKKALNPVAAMISLPIKYDYDQDIGPDKQGTRDQLTIQPVIPFSIGKDWNLISRTIVPMINQNNVRPGAGKESGLGDITQQFYFSPKEPTAGGWILGAGPQILMRTGADGLSSEKWGLGPAFVALKQEHGWTYGMLATHMWDISGSDQAADVNISYLQPFLGYTTKSFTTFNINTESTYNWVSEKWSVPINFTVTQLLKVGGQPLTIMGGARYWADTPEGVGPKGWGFRFQVALLFPK